MVCVQQVWVTQANLQRITFIMNLWLKNQDAYKHGCGQEGASRAQQRCKTHVYIYLDGPQMQLFIPHTPRPLSGVVEQNTK
jgi:hypothetical protein